MANSSSGESGNSLPEFLSYSSNGNNNKPQPKVYDLCPVCLKSEKFFYCSDCLRNGAFTHSHDKYYERFADKKLRLYAMTQKKNRIIQRYQTLLSGRIKAEDLKQGTDFHRQRNALLKECIKHSNEEVARTTKHVELTKIDNEQSLVRQTKLMEKISTVREEVENLQQNITNKQSTLESLNFRLKDIVRNYVHLLVKHIFTISEVSVTESPSEKVDCLELEEAQHTTYIKGRWEITTQSHPEIQHCVVAPLLPSTGNYSAYTDWISKEHDTMPLTEKDSYQRDLGYSIGAALTFTTHFVMVLSNFMDIHVPKHLCYSEFCGNELNRQQFLHRVTKLNANVIHLCLSQNVDTTLIRPRQTIRNLLLLLDRSTSDLGRFGAINMNTKWLDSIEEDLLKDMSATEENNSNNGEDIEQDWEEFDDLDDIDNEMCHYGVMSDPPQVPRTGSFTGELMSSVASFWRAATKLK